MSTRDPFSKNPRVVAELVRMYERSASRLREIVLHPNGKTQSAQEFNRGRAAQLLAQVNAEINALKHSAAAWIGPSLKSAFDQGIETANRQAIAAGVIGPDLRSNITGAGGWGFNLVNRDAVRIIASVTYDDLKKAADAMQGQSYRALTRMADLGVTNADVNRIIATGVIEGSPRETIQTLRTELEKINGKRVTVTTRSGGTMTFKAGHYARIVAITKTREAVVTAKLEQFQRYGIDIVEIIGRDSENPCSKLLGKKFSISGTSDAYPPFSSVSEGQPPYNLFHPQCSKSIAPVTKRRLERERQSDDSLAVATQVSEVPT